MKIRPVEAELFHKDNGKDRQTDVTKLRVLSLNFAGQGNPNMSCLDVT